jgi:uncharacterized protein YkwD
MLEPAASAPASILPTNVGIGIPSARPIVLRFDRPMDRQSVSASLLVHPATGTELAWSQDGRQLTVAPAGRWQTDQRYDLIVGSGATGADGRPIVAPLRYSFTTETAPTITEFAVNRAGASEAMSRLSHAAVADGRVFAAADTASQTSAATSISLRFSAAMNHAQVEAGFMISPTVDGLLTWQGTALTFTPSQRLDPSTRYAVTVLGAHDLQGNQLGGDMSFSFTVADAARVVRISPGSGATGVKARIVTVWFSDAVDAKATGKAFRLYDATAKRAVAGSVAWNVAHDRLTFTSKGTLAAGHRFEVRIGSGSLDADGNALAATFGFTTKATAVTAATGAARTSAPATVYPAPSGSAMSYALALINASRAAHGLYALRLDSALSAVAQAHAVDQARYGYFSHTGRDGSSASDRIRAAGISFSWSGENQCEDYGTITAALQWCHSVMMAEPWPGYPNHIGNILSSHFTKVGFGYARASDGNLIMTWDFVG